ncbi:choline-phosphate cytidylyltransferase [Kineosphaera limosa]|uniref:Putative glycerol-3-phosphate cytidylyltransferase/oxidoreductase n=1 Tax=Kineosphaera limosa NBRC 100340 TaxID=1184609 RepID=K6VMN1_9MICO|nr:Gfo/Idh/MocA family oxidoreductase [Kineosphaera limosa]NYD99847.1 choline-phosphate cytidylyltransferase [Kineosphaera limosa]GAB97478.1 putative glycerol-3-phosphate cytidylyltransferase/oxidoreductase [Kineosphaera limosa NBRC 100340]
MTTVITYGTFDVFHHGHRRLLERAKSLGDRLIVGVTSSDYDRGRGKLNVTDSLPQRIRSVEESGLADLVLVEEYEGQKVRDIEQHGVDIFAIGSDWEGHFDHLRDFCEVVYLPRTAGVSSTQVRTQAHSLLRVGVVGTGRIAHRMVAEARFVSGVEFVAAFNPRHGSAASFVEEHGLQQAHSEWGPFVDGIDAVYIASPHHAHVDYAQAAMAAGLHVLCEKPAALSAADLTGLHERAQGGGLVFMEAVKTAYLPGFERMVAIVRSGTLGQVRAVRCAFTKLVEPGAREWVAPAGGSMTELGTYGLLPIVKLLGADLPAGQFTVIRSHGVDAFTSARFVYPQAVGSFEVGMGVKTEGSLVVSGTTGYLVVPAPWWLTRTFEIHREDPSLTRQYSVPFEGDGLRYELSEFVRAINHPRRSGLALTDAESMAMASALEDFCVGRGVTQIGDESAGLEAALRRQGAAARGVADLGHVTSPLVR